MDHACHTNRQQPRIITHQSFFQELSIVITHQILALLFKHFEINNISTTCRQATREPCGVVTPWLALCTSTPRSRQRMIWWRDLAGRWHHESECCVRSRRRTRRECWQTDETVCSRRHDDLGCCVQSSRVTHPGHSSLHSNTTTNAGHHPGTLHTSCPSVSMHIWLMRVSDCVCNKSNHYLLSQIWHTVMTLGHSDLGLILAQKVKHQGHTAQECPRDVYSVITLHQDSPDVSTTSYQLSRHLDTIHTMFSPH